MRFGTNEVGSDEYAALAPTIFHDPQGRSVMLVSCCEKSVEGRRINKDFSDAAKTRDHSSWRSAYASARYLYLFSETSLGESASSMMPAMLRSGSSFLRI